MPLLKLKGTDTYESIPDDAINEALATGLYEPPAADARIPVVADGFAGEVSGKDYGAYRDTYEARPETEAEDGQRGQREQRHLVAGEADGLGNPQVAETSRHAHEA